MEDFKVRLVNEKHELEKNIVKLEVYIGSKPNIDSEHIELLKEQLLTMKKLNDIFEQRFKLLNINV
jgi:hypothetical protein